MSLNPAELKTLLAQKKAKQEEVTSLDKKIALFLGGLPESCGFNDDLEGFINAVRDSFPEFRATQKTKGVKKQSSAVLKNTGSGSARGKVTEEIKAQIKKLCVEGKTTREMVEIVGLKTATINKVKDDLKLVKKRHKSLVTDQALEPAQTPFPQT